MGSRERRSGKASYSTVKRGNSSFTSAYVYLVSVRLFSLNFCLTNSDYQPQAKKRIRKSVHMEHSE